MLFRSDNAMDVDIITKVYKKMTDEERTEFMKKGLCFKCRKQGHLSRDCPEGKGQTPATVTPKATAATPTPATPKKMSAKELTAHIRSLTALLNDEEKTAFYDEAEKEGF